MAVIFLHTIAGVRREQCPSVFGRSIGDDALKKATSVFFTNLTLALTGALVLCAVQVLPLRDALFETFSAIGTVGMTTGVTRSLTPLSQAVVIFLMYCGRVGSIDPITVPELAKKAQQALASRCNQPLDGPAVQVKFADTGKTVQRLAVISGAGGSLFAEAVAEGADCLLTGEANHHHALDAKRLGLSLIAAGHYATEFPVTAAVAAALRTALPEVEVLVSTENRDPYTYL